MIDIESLRKKIGNRDILHAISLSAEMGEIAAIAVQSQSVRREFIRLLEGYSKPDRGYISFAGLDLESDREAAHQHVSFVESDCAGHPDETLRTWLGFQFRLRIRSAQYRKDFLRRSVERFRLLPFLSLPMRTLSRAVIMRANLSVELIRDPTILVFDDPFFGLVHDETHFLKSLLLELTSSGKIILILAMESESFEEITDRRWRLHDGQLKVEKERSKKDSKPKTLGRHLVDMTGLIDPDRSVEDLPSWTEDIDSVDDLGQKKTTNGDAEKFILAPHLSKEIKNEEDHKDVSGSKEKDVGGDE